jgi:hypothetical protein
MVAGLVWYGLTRAVQTALLIWLLAAADASLRATAPFIISAVIASALTGVQAYTFRIYAVGGAAGGRRLGNGAAGRAAGRATAAGPCNSCSRLGACCAAPQPAPPHPHAPPPSCVIPPLRQGMYRRAGAPRSKSLDALDASSSAGGSSDGFVAAIEADPQGSALSPAARKLAGRQAALSEP